MKKIFNNRNHMEFIMLMTFIMCMLLNSVLRGVQASEDIIGELISGTDSHIEEYGITVNFITDMDQEALCRDILKQMDFINPEENKITKNDKMYNVDFQTNSINGYIETTKCDKYNIIILNIVVKNDEYELKNMKNHVENVISSFSKDAKFFEYVKAKSSLDNVENIQHKMNAILQEANARDMQTIKLRNGYSSTANTGRYMPIACDGRAMDLNYAVCNYQSGNYVIIGTPQILTSY